MRNETYRAGDKVSLPVADGTTPGTPVLVGELPGITATAEGGGGNPDGFASVWLDGAHTVDVAGAATHGQIVYINASGGLTTTAPATPVVWGHALEAKGTGTAPIVVKIAKV